jgi:hypothetical protein
MVDDQAVGEVAPGDTTSIFVSPGIHQISIRPTQTKPAPWASKDPIDVLVENNLTICLIDADSDLVSSID